MERFGSKKPARASIEDAMGSRQDLVLIDDCRGAGTTYTVVELRNGRPWIGGYVHLRQIGVSLGQGTGSNRTNEESVQQGKRKQVR